MTPAWNMVASLGVAGGAGAVGGGAGGGGAWAWLVPLEYWRTGGWVLVPIALTSAGIWALFMGSRRAMRRVIRDSACVERGIEARREGFGSLAALFDWLRGCEGAVSRWMVAALSAPGAGRSPAEGLGMLEEQVAEALRRDVVLLAALTAVAPLLGLFGTVVGMIETFDAVGGGGGETGRRVAAGISEALLTTQFGLIVALPGVFGLARLDRLSREVAVRLASCRALLLTRLEPARGGGEEGGAC